MRVPLSSRPLPFAPVRAAYTRRLRGSGDARETSLGGSLHGSVRYPGLAAAVSLAALVLVLGACTESQKSGDATPPAVPTRGMVAGKIAGRTSPSATSTTWIKDQLFKQTTRGGNPLKVYEIRNRALEQMASEQALDAEAEKSGKDRDTLMKEEVEKRAEVSDATSRSTTTRTRNASAACPSRRWRPP